MASPSASLLTAAPGAYGPGTVAVTGLSKASPFPGLRPYDEEDSGWFFGRGREINDLLKRLRLLHFVAIVGASGCGKSSLIRAGVLPHIRDGYLDAEWSIATFRPGERPVANLAEALAPEMASQPERIEDTLHAGSLGLVKAVQAAGLARNRKVLIVVDQFEELFQFAHRGGDSAQEEVKEFLKLLLAAAASDEVDVYVVITMRLEWLNECATYVGMAEAINEGIYLVPQMSRRQFSQAILGPLDAADGLVSSALLDRMLNDLDGRSDQLPVLQHALLRLWEGRRGTDPFDMGDYEAVGTFSNCLSAHAEEVFAELSAPQKRVAELLFRSITQVYKGRKIRRPRSVSETLTATGSEFAQLETVVFAFSRTGRSFLVTTQGKLGPQSIVDVSHEALIRQWERLTGWVEDEAETQSRIDRLGADAAEWDRDRKAFHSSLYRGRQLKRAQDLILKLDPASASFAFLKAAKRAQFVVRARIVGMSLLIFLMVAWVVWQRELDGRATQQRLVLEMRREQEEADKRAASAQEQKAKLFQEGIVKQIHDANGSVTALEAIALSVSAQRVYVQFVRGSLVDQPKSVQALLQKQGYAVPPLQAVQPDRAPDHTQVRFFHGEDQVGAGKIAGLLGSLLKTNIAIQSTANPNNVVPLGQFEVWLAAAPVQVQPVAPVQTQQVPIETTEKKPEQVPADVPASKLTPIIPLFIPSAEKIQQGQSVTLSWRTGFASAVELRGVGPVPANGSTQVTPQQTATFELFASGAGGSISKQVRVEVVPAPVAEVPVPVPAPAAVDPEPAAIKAALNRYKEAYESESLDDVKKAWPSVPKPQQKNLKMIFDQFNAIRMTLTCREEDIHVAGTSATAACRQTVVYIAKGQKQPELSSPTAFKLRKQDGVWVIESLQ